MPTNPAILVLEIKNVNEVQGGWGSNVTSPSCRKEDRVFLLKMKKYS